MQFSVLASHTSSHREARSCHHDIRSQRHPEQYHLSIRYNLFCQWLCENASMPSVLYVSRTQPAYHSLLSHLPGSHIRHLPPASRPEGRRYASLRQVP